MADIAINPVTRRVQFTGNTGTGPFAFTFNILADEDIVVYKNTTLLTLTTDYTVATNADGTGSVTLVAALIASDVLTIIGGRELERTTDFVTAGDLLAASLNEQLDSIVIMAQQLDEKLGRSLKVNPGDVFTDLELPGKDARKGTVMAFNATSGDPEAGPEIADVSSIASITADIATLADIEDGTDATDAIQTVAGISGNVTTVAGISSDVTTVAGITGNIASVVADEADIGVVAGISGDVSTVSAISTDVTTVAADGTDIGVVAGISSDVTTVSGISTDVTTVSSISSDVTTVVGNAASITTVAGNSSNVTIVADNITDVNTVASNIGSITTKVSKSGDTMTGNLLFDDTSKVLLGTRSNLQIYHSATAIAASNITLYFTNGSTSGTMEITDTDHTISVSDTVRVDSPEILNSTPVTVSGVVLSSLQQDLTVSATTATTFTVPVTYASDPGTTGTLGQAGTYYYYTGSATSYISEQGAGSLHVLGSEINVYNADETSQLAQFSTTATKLFHNNSEKLTTTATGISLPEDLTVQGNLTVQGTTITVDSASAQSIDLGDGDKMRFGDSNDAYIEWNTSGYFDVRSTGRFDLLSSGNDLRLSTATNVGLIVNHTGGTPAVQLYNSGVERLATTSIGVDISGTLTSDGLTVDTDTLHVDATNNRVGIGTTSPSAKLTVSDAGSSLFSPNVYIAGATADVMRLGFDSGGARTNIVSGRDSGTSGATNGYMAFETRQSGGGMTEAMRIDSNGSVGIGTSSPDSFYSGARNLVVGSGSGEEGITIYGGDTSTSYLLFADGTSGSALYAGQVRYNHSTDAMEICTNGNSSPRMTIDSSGNVGIGTSSPSTILQVTGNSTSRNTIVSNFTLDGGTSVANPYENFGFGINFIGRDYGNAVRNYASINTIMEHKSSSSGGGDAGFETGLSFYTNGGGASDTDPSERMRIDSSGNLLVGKTSVDTTTDGLVMRERGQVYATSDGNTPVILNRRSSDGDIAQFRKDNTTVGSITTKAGAIQLCHTSIGVGVSADNLYPTNGSGAASDNTVDIGDSTARFKDLYLSGGVYLGGTGSANHLDDYEEGTWTFGVADSSGNSSTTTASTGYYTKIGNTVHAFAQDLNNIDTTGLTAGDNLLITGLPFASASSAQSGGSTGLDNFNFGNNAYVIPNILGSQTNVRLRVFTNSAGDSFLTVSSITSGTSDINRFYICYQTA